METLTDITGKLLRLKAKVIVDTYKGVAVGTIVDITKNTVKVKLAVGSRESTRVIDRLQASEHLYAI